MRGTTFDAIPDPNRLVIYPSRVKLSFLFLGGIVFVALGAWIGISSNVHGWTQWKVVVASGLGVPFFGLCSAYAAARLIVRRPLLEIDPMGIMDASSAVGAGRLSWAEVDHMVLYEYLGQTMLGIVPTNLDLVMQRQAPLRRLSMKLNMMLGCPPINVAQAGIDLSLTELAGWLRDQHWVRILDESADIADS